MFFLVGVTGELYVQAHRMFDESMYTQLLAIIDLAVKQAIITTDNFETEFVRTCFVLSSHSFFLFCPWNFNHL